VRRAGAVAVLFGAALGQVGDGRNVAGAVREERP
jgi:hypothetical protein